MGAKIEGREPEGFLFSLDKKIHKKFRQTCAKKKLAPNFEIEKFMQKFIDEHDEEVGEKKKK